MKNKNDTHNETHPISIGYEHWRTVVRGERGLSPRVIHDFAKEVGEAPEKIFLMLYPLSKENGKAIEKLFKDHLKTK